MPRKKKEEHVYLTEREKKLAAMKSGRIKKEDLMPIVMKYKALKAAKPKAQMPRDLADIIILIIDKNLGSPSWRRYSLDWKEEMRGRALEHLLKYSHNFDPSKCAAGKDDPYNYFAMIANMAFTQSLKKLKNHSDNTILINHEVLYNDSQWSGDTGSIDFDYKIEMGISDPQISNLDWGQSL